MRLPFWNSYFFLLDGGPNLLCQILEFPMMHAINLLLIKILCACRMLIFGKGNVLCRYISEPPFACH